MIQRTTMDILRKRLARPVVLVPLVFATLGVVLLVSSSAAVRINHIALSEGSVGGPAEVVTDGTASEGSVVQFKKLPPTPTPTEEPTPTATATPEPTVTATPQPTPMAYEVSIERATNVAATLFSHISDSYLFGSGHDISRVWSTFKIDTDDQQNGTYYAINGFMTENASCLGGANNDQLIGYCPIYMGLQVNNASGMPDHPETKKMALFSVWDATENVVPPNGWSVNFKGEGIGKSNRVAYQWQPGKEYTLSMGRDDARSSAAAVWWDATITDVANGQVTSLGSIKLVSGNSTASYFATFHEIYSGETNDCYQVEYSAVTVSNTLYEYSDGTKEKPFSRRHVLRNVDTNCNRLFNVVDDPKGDIYKSTVNPNGL
jgi:hypothetical protein